MVMFDPIANKKADELISRYNKGKLPPQMGDQLWHPSQLIAYDVFDRTTEYAEGFGISDSGQKWAVLQGSGRVRAPGFAETTSSGSIQKLDIGATQKDYSVYALSRSNRGSGRNHAILISYVDDRNYLYGGYYSGSIRVTKVVDGVETMVASGDSGIFSVGKTWEWLIARVVSVWEPYDCIVVGDGVGGVRYNLNSDVDASLFIANLTTGIMLNHGVSYLSRFFVVDEGGDWS